MEYQRDILVNEIFEAATKDKEIFFISADFGAPSLDKYREKLPEQFIHAGISEQNMIDIAAGLALSEKKVYVYAMGPFISLRCLEQIKCCLALMNLPVTIVSVGLGLGYADAGPTHYATEDLACLRSIVNLEVYTPSDITVVAQLAKFTYQVPALRVLRLDRGPMDRIYKSGISVHQGCEEIYPGSKIAIMSNGYALYRVWKNWEEIAAGSEVGLIDVYRVKPLNLDALQAVFEKYDRIITVEEQCLSGGFGSAILEAASDLGMTKPVKRIGLEERYYFENGGREYLLDAYGLSNGRIKKLINGML